MSDLKFGYDIYLSAHIIDSAVTQTPEAERCQFDTYSLGSSVLVDNRSDLHISYIYAMHSVFHHLLAVFFFQR